MKIENIPVVKQVLSEDQFYSQMQNRRYVRHYRTLMDRSIGRNLDCYTEKHHIVPKCLGGDNKGKLAILTAAEHYVAHQLLVKLFPKKPNLVHAAKMMTVDRYGGRINNKRYEWLKKRIAMVMSERVISKETRAKISKAHKNPSPERRYQMGCSMRGKTHTQETKEKCRLASTGKKMSPESIAKSVAGRVGYKMPPARRKLQKEIMTGRRPSTETRLKMSASHIGLKRTAEQNAAQSKRLLGHILSPETKAKISKSLTGKKLSKQTRLKMSKSRTGMKHSPETIAKRVAATRVTKNRNRKLRELETSI